MATASAPKAATPDQMTIPRSLRMEAEVFWRIPTPGATWKIGTVLSQSIPELTFRVRAAKIRWTC